MTNSVCTQSSNSFKTQSLSFQTKSKVRFDMERLKCLNLEPVTFVGTYAASLPLGNAESSRPAVLVGETQENKTKNSHASSSYVVV